MLYTPHPYQQRALNWVLDHPACALFMSMGLGKSVVTLTAISRLIDDADISSALVVAPKKVAETTWTSETEKWDHLSHLTVSRVIGDRKHRVAALATPADIYVIGRDSFVWLCEYYHDRLPFDMLVLDELTSFKSPKSQRFKAIKHTRRCFSRVVGLTGTPSPNGLLDLWSQIYCLDMGERLGKFVTHYREAYFHEIKHNNITIKCTPRKGAEDSIRGKIADICLTMQASDYLTLPGCIIRDVSVPLSPQAAKSYLRLQESMILEVKEDLASNPEKVAANSAAALLNKLLQLSNGAIYNEDGAALHVHDDKLEVLVELVEQAQSPVLVFYQFRHDISRIEKALKGFKVRTYQNERDLADWNAGKIDALLAHPASTAFGLNMQAGGHYIIWFGLSFNLELYQQANARLHRQGQQHPVTVYRLLAEVPDSPKPSADQVAAASLDAKKTVQQSLMDGLKLLLD